VRANIEAEEKLAQWLGVESVLIYPSVMLTNFGAIPGLVGRQDAIAIDEQAHSSMQEAAKIARANGAKVAIFAHDDPRSLEQTLCGLSPYRCALVCIDGVYSMSGVIPPMAELNEVARARDAVLYIDDAHGTGVLGKHGRGTVFEALGSYDNTFVVGSLSKAFSCAGGFIGCPEPFHRLLKIRSSSYVFGGPVVPPYLEAIGTVIDILRSDEYDTLRARLDAHIRNLTRGLSELGLIVIGGATPIVSVMIGDEADTLRAGKFLFDRGYYIQSVLFPAVPYHAGVLRIQCNANHDEQAIDGLLDAFAALVATMPLPGRTEPMVTDLVTPLRPDLGHAEVSSPA
jgi:7-keto-8-aminopelargonate synthetase-like enzyme